MTHYGTRGMTCDLGKPCEGAAMGAAGKATGLSPWGKGLPMGSTRGGRLNPWGGGAYPWGGGLNPWGRGPIG